MVSKLPGRARMRWFLIFSISSLVSGLSPMMAVASLKISLADSAVLSVCTGAENRYGRWPCASIMRVPAP